MLTIKDLKMISRLEKQENYEEIIKRYGKFFIKYYKNDMYYRDIKMESGSKLKLISAKINVLGDILAREAFILGMIIILSIPRLSETTFKEESYQAHKEEIDDYEEKVHEYLRTKNYNDLSDLEIILDLVKDQHEISKYGDPKLNIDCFARLDILNGEGVCRNLADDLAYKLNELNPEYNARMLVISADFGNWERNNDVITTADDYVAEPPKERNKLEQVYDNLKSYFQANHAVTLVDLLGRDITLIVDPTNSGFGAIINGKLEMFNSDSEKFITIDTSELFLRGYEEYFEYIKDVNQSYFLKENYDELEKEFGLDAQNNALNKIK